MTETREPLAIPSSYEEDISTFLQELKDTHATTGSLTQDQLDRAIRHIELTDTLLKATVHFVNVADATVANLEAHITERDEEIAEKDREIAALSIQLRDKERDLELVTTDD